MAQLINASINLSKIDKSKIIEGKEVNGVKNKYINITISINDEIDQYGNQVSIYESQSQTEREAKANRNYLGNGKVAWTSEGGSTAKQTPATPAPAATPAAPVVEEGDDLPF